MTEDESSGGAPLADIPNKDENLERGEAIAEVKRLKTKAYEILERQPAYQQEAMRWIRESLGNENPVVLRLTCGGKPIEVIINNGFANRQQNSSLAVRAYPTGTSIYTNGDYTTSPEQVFEVSSPVNQLKEPEIKWVDTSRPLEEQLSSRNRGTVREIDAFIDRMKSGFSQPTMSPAPSAPTK